MKMSSSRDGLYLKKCTKSDNNFQRRSSGIALHELREIDFGIHQNAVKSIRNLISCDDTLVDILPDREPNRRPKANHSENHLHNSSFESYLDNLEMPNGTKCNLNQLEYLKNATKLMNGDKQKFYDYSDRLINSTLINNQLNDEYEQYDSSFNLDNFSREQLRNPKRCEIGKSTEDYSSNSSKSKSEYEKSKSCTDLKIF